jgi:hypothetical protein
MCLPKDFFVNQRIFEAISIPSEPPSTMPWRGDLPSRPKQQKKLPKDIFQIVPHLCAVFARMPKSKQSLL